MTVGPPRSTAAATRRTARRIGPAAYRRHPASGRVNRAARAESEAEPEQAGRDERLRREYDGGEGRRAEAAAGEQDGLDHRDERKKPQERHAVQREQILDREVRGCQ